MRLNYDQLRKKTMMKITLFWDLNLRKQILTTEINFHSKKEKKGNLSTKGLLVLSWETHSLILPPATIKPMMGHKQQKYKKLITIQEKII
jgi:hypothetical protein